VIWAPLFLLLFTPRGSLGEPSNIRPESVPFWKAKEKYYRRIQEERAIIVAVHTETIPQGERLVMNGGGQISTPLEFAFKESLRHEILQEVSDYIQEVRPENEQLFVRSKAFGHEATMWLKITSMPNSSIHFEIAQGTLKGLKADIHFEKIESVKTEIGISGSYDYVKFPIARIFAEFGIEVILQRMAIRLRSVVEEHYRNSLGKAKK
jgi:hypothetical protein